MAVKIEDLLEQYEKGTHVLSPGKLSFSGVDGYDVYNPTAVFSYRGWNMICARVEKRDSEDSTAMFFYETAENTFVPAEGFPVFEIQDPCLTKLYGCYVLGGTKVDKDTDGRICSWKTVFYRGTSLEELTYWTCGPIGMKDVRLCECADQGIGVFTRPQGKIGGRGSIGFYIAKNEDEVHAEKMEQATLLDLFYEKDWGGVNAAYLLENGNIGVLGHIATFTGEDIRHYYPMSFLFDPVSREYTTPKLAAVRKDFLPGESKRGDLQDVLFSGGLRFLAGGKAELYVGVSDCEVQMAVIENPFIVD